MAGTYLFTSESVTEGHPDKLADQISDAVLDALIKQDPAARVALETLLTRGLAVVAGELTTTAYVEIADVVRETINNVGYTKTEYGFEGDTTGVMLAIQKQSTDINQGVDRDSVESQGAGDQGMMFGFACDETAELMPLPIMVAHRLTRAYSDLRRAEPELGLRPDGKSQVTVAYVNGRPDHFDTIVMAAQHDDRPEVVNSIKDIVIEQIVRPVVAQFPGLDNGNIRFHVNPTGRFVIGGPQGDTGVTGRKIIVDTYGGYARHGGGAFSGKDPSKVDRSAAYVARYLAKNVVKAGLARKCEIQLAYAIGVPEPVSIYVDTFGTGAVPDATIAARLQDKTVIDLRPGLIIKKLGLVDAQRVRYTETAKNGHFGNPAFPWEAVDLAPKLI
ncbi:MAG: methionine adenosyltransferase [Armatimonadetes bacterium]|nr:methionine adenosyltransferase [Armatimonadota bacterium]